MLFVVTHKKLKIKPPKTGCEKASRFLGVIITSPVKTVLVSFDNQKLGFFLNSEWLVEMLGDLPALALII
jgi:hypothetical protein